MKAVVVLFALCGLVLATSGSTADDSLFMVRGGPQLNGGSIESTQVADLSAHMAGLAPLHTNTDRTNYPVVDVFTHPNAHIFCVVDGVGEQTLASVAQQLIFLNNRNTVRVNKLTTDMDGLASLATTITGESPVVHGVFGRSWSRGNNLPTVQAFQPNQGHLAVGSIVDVAYQTYRGNGKLVSVSVDQQFSSALAPNPAVVSRHPWGFTSYFFDETTKTVHESRQTERALFADTELIEKIGSLSTGALTITIEGDIVTVAIGEMVALFDLSEPVDRLFFTELVAVQLATQDVTQSQTDRNMFAVGISTLKQLQQSHSIDSTEYKLAILLVDTTLDYVYTTIAAAKTNVLFETTLLGSTTTHHTATRPVRSMQNMLKKKKPNTEDADPTTYTLEQVAMYQIGLWISVALIATIAFASWAFYQMDVGDDSILYRVTGARPQ